jgi:hypothetical protein
MKKTMKRRLVLGREFVKALGTELGIGRLVDVRGGVITYNSLQIRLCTDSPCRTIDMDPTG